MAEPRQPAAQDGPDPGDAASSGLSALVAECIDRWEDEGPAALDELCRSHPALAAELRSRISRLGEAGLLGEAGDDGRLPERLGNFRILSLLGRGAMGVVYLAEQEELGRRVALKLVRPELLFFPGARERFRREVQAVARLSHPGIVPVYAGGEDHGIPYCAMEFVRGASLQDVLDELAGRDTAKLSGADLAAAVQAVVQRRATPDAPAASAPGEAAALLAAGTWTAACLRVARAVAEALAHAHAHGVLHRDIKPGNIMVTPDGRVLLLDFGLAAAEGSARLTSSGGQVGSLAWMSPESLRADRDAVDARSDVYSLGATLYELLTLRSPFAGGGVDVTLARVLAGRAAPPRQLNAAIPRDAETVCLTAMDREPARRYATAAALAADLANVLELRPIAARRPGAALRARRWAQRSPAAAAAVVLGAVLVVGGPVGYGVLQSRAASREHELNADLLTSNTKLDGALADVRTANDGLTQALGRSERNFQAALDAVDHVLRETAIDDLEDVPRMQQARLAAIDRAIELFASLETENPDDPQVLGERAELHASRGEVLRDLGRPEEALAEFRLAADGRRHLLETGGGDAQRGFLATALNDEGKTLFSMFRMSEAVPPYEEALTRLRASLATQPDDAGRLRKLAVALANLAETRRAQGEFDAADAELHEGLEHLARAEELKPGDAEIAWTGGRLAGDVGMLQRLREQTADALEWHERSLKGYRAAHQLAPTRRYYGFDVTTGLFACANCELDLRLGDLGEARLVEAQSIVDDLLRDYPDAERYRARRSELLEALAIRVGTRGDYARAGDLLAAGLVDREAACALSPGRCDLQIRAAQTQVNLANSLIQQRLRLDEAREMLRAAVARLRSCAAAGELPASDAAMLDNAHYLSALAECEADRVQDARTAIADFEGQSGAGAMDLRRAADLWNEWVLALRRATPEAAARAADEADGRAKFMDRLGRAIDAGYDDVQELQSTPSLDAFREDADFAALLARVESHAKP